MSFPTPGYLTRRASASSSLVLLVFLQSVATDPSHQLSHDRLAIAVPVDATVAQLQSLIEQRYQQLLSEDEEDGESTHRIVVRRVYKVAEFAYVVSRHEVVGEVFANEEQLQADVSIRTDTEKQRQHREEESKESEETQWDDDKAERPHPVDDGHDSLTTPTLPLRSTSLTAHQRPTTPTRHSSRPSQHSQSRVSPALDRSTLTSQQRHSQSAMEEKDKSKHGAALEEVEGSKKVNRQLVQLLNAPKSTAHSHARDIDAQAVFDVTEQKEGSSEARGEEEKEEKEDVAEGITQRLRRSNDPRVDETEDAMIEADEGSALSGGRVDGTEETKEQGGNVNTAAQAELVDYAKRVGGTDERHVIDNTFARSVRSARPSASTAADSLTTSAPAEKKKRGRKRKNVEAAAPTTSTTPHPPAPASSSSCSASSSTSSSASSTTTSVSLSALPPECALPAGPSDILCVLCGQGGGVLKQTIRSKKAAPEWCHQMCATWCDGTYFSWKNHRVYNINVALDRTKRKHLQCRLCQQPVGTTAPVQCVDDDCDEAFHITCGVAHHYQTFEAEPDEEAKRRGMQEEFVAACPRHNNPKYDEKNDDGCCICLYTRPSQPEMSAKLTCVKCGVCVHRTCYYNLPSDSVSGEVSAAVSGQIDWQRWTCMCCEYKQKGVYYWVSESNTLARAKKKVVSDNHSDTSDSRKSSGRDGQREKSAQQATASTTEKARTGRAKRRKDGEELRNKRADGEEKRNDMDEEKQEAGAEDVLEKQEDIYVEEQESKEATHDDASEEAPSTGVARANGRSGTRSAKRGSGTSKKRQKIRQEVILRTGFDGSGVSGGTELSSHSQDGEVDGEDGKSDVVMNGAAAAETDEEKTPSQQHRLAPPGMSPVNNRAAAVLKSPLLPMAAHLDPRHAAAIRRFEENAFREKRVAQAASTTAQQPQSSRSTRDERATRSHLTPQGQQQPHRSSSNGLIINTIRASTSAASLSQPATSSPSSAPVSPPRSTLSRKEYIHAISRYSALTLTAVLHHHGLNYTGNKEGQVARLMATMAQLPTEDERRQWEQAWERVAGEDKDKPMLRMPDREFEQHRQTGSASRSRAQAGGVQPAVAGFGPTREVQRLTQSAGLAEAVQEENMEEEVVDELGEDDTEDEEDEVQDGDEQSDGEKLQKAIDAIEEIEDSSEESGTDHPPTAHQHGKVAATTGRGRGGGRGRGKGGRGRGASQVNGKQSGTANGTAVKQVNGHGNGSSRGGGTGRGRHKGRA